MPNDEMVSVRYMVDDVDEAIAFYTTMLGFEILTNAPPAFADVKRGNLRLLLAGPRSSAGRPMPDGRQPGPGGWNRIHLILGDIEAEVMRLRDAGATFRNDIVTGPGGKQILLEDPSGNVVELFQPASSLTPEAKYPPVTTPAPTVDLRTIAREWGRLGVVGFGGPPAHISLLRHLCVDERGWLSARDFEDAIATTNLLPGPASTQLAIFCAWRVRGRLGALVGGLCFIGPGLVMILGLSMLFLGTDPPVWVLGAAAGAGAGVPAVAVSAAAGLAPPSWKRAGADRSARFRWMLYLIAGALAAATVGTFLVVVIALCGIAEIVARVRPSGGPANPSVAAMLAVAPTGVVTGGMAALAWVALKVGALSYGGGFVIIPLMQHDAVDTYRWMTAPQFLNAVALGQLTPGPVVLTIAAVGYAAGGIAAGVLAAAIAFGPSFLFVMVGGPHFDRLRQNLRAQAFLIGAGAAAIGAIAGAAVPLARSLGEPWQISVLAVAAVWLLALRRGVVPALLVAGAFGGVVAAAGAPLPT